MGRHGADRAEPVRGYPPSIDPTTATAGPPPVDARQAEMFRAAGYAPAQVIQSAQIRQNAVVPVPVEMPTGTAWLVTAICFFFPIGLAALRPWRLIRLRWAAGDQTGAFRAYARVERLAWWAICAPFALAIFYCAGITFGVFPVPGTSISSGF